MKIGVVGLGYVGLPLLVALSKSGFEVCGFDISIKRIEELSRFYDITNELSNGELKKFTENVVFTCDSEQISDCSLFIVTVPTPINDMNSPDLNPIISASKTVGKILHPNDIVVYESTVYPGATEEVCVPILEEFSGLKFKRDFHVGYSPERINPGDKINTIETIVKIVSASNPEALNKINEVYSKIVKAGTYKAPSIKVAEAAKVIENTQRDLNIALVNELSKIFNILELDTNEVLEAAATKWNFQKFTPGMVGGHCIGVDPYYLTFKAESVNYRPEVILAGRRINDEMPKYITDQLLRLIQKRRKRKFKNVLLMGLTFKGNCPDLRNSKSLELYSELEDVGFCVDAYDPWVEANYTTDDINLVFTPIKKKYDIVIIAVEHKKFIEMGEENIRSLGESDALFMDLKCIFPKAIDMWRL